MPATARRIALATGLHYNVLEWAAAPGAPDDVTFVLVHGFTDLAAGWDAVAERLTALGHVVAPDLRGHGDSDWVGPGGYYYFMDYVADLDDAIAQLARPRVIVVGHSMGGGVVVSYWAGSRPALLERARADRRHRHPRCRGGQIRGRAPRAGSTHGRARGPTGA